MGLRQTPYAAANACFLCCTMFGWRFREMRPTVYCWAKQTKRKRAMHRGMILREEPAYITPILWQAPGGKTTLLVPSSTRQCTGSSPKLFRPPPSEHVLEPRAPKNASLIHVHVYVLHRSKPTSIYLISSGMQIRANCSMGWNLGALLTSEERPGLGESATPELPGQDSLHQPRLLLRPGLKRLGRTAACSI